MINPAEIPQIPGDMEALRGHAATLRSSGSSFSSTGANVHSTWQGLAAVYEAPEAGQLLNATRPVSEISDSIGGDVELVAKALTTYADTVAPIKARLESLRTQARAFVGSVEGHDDWREDEGKVGAHNQLLSQVNEAVAEWMAAQRACANAINATYGGTRYVADNGDGRREGNEFGYSKDQLNSAMAGEGLPWGKPEEHDGGILGDVSDFFVGIKDGAVQMVTDLGALIGYSDGQWSWSTAGAAWKGLGTFALAIGTYSMPGGMTLDQSVGLPGFKRGEMGGTLLNAGKSIIAYDQWGNGHNGRAAGQATFNVVSAVVGTKGAGGALRGTGAAIQGAKAAGTGARVGGAMVRAGDFVAKMPTVGELGLKVANKLDVHIPHLGPTPAVAGAGHHVDMHVPETRGPEVARMDGGGHGDGPSLGDGRHRGSDGPTTSQSSAHVGDAADGGHKHVPNAPQTHHVPQDAPHLTPHESGHSQHAPDGHGEPGHGDTHSGTSHPDTGDHTDIDHGGAHDSGRGATPHSPDTEPQGVQPDGSWQGEHGLRLDPGANAAAERFIERSAANEPRITEHMRVIEGSIDHGRLEGLDFRLKGEDSLKRKLATDMAEDINVAPDEALAGIRDSVRYTLEVPSGNYSHGVQHAVHQLQSQGFENIKFKNTWDESGYKGINSTWRDPATGQTFELQFHTPESFAAKMDAHELYEQQRLPGNSPERIEELQAQQREIFDRLDRPSGSAELHVPQTAGAGTPFDGGGHPNGTSEALDAGTGGGNEPLVRRDHDFSAEVNESGVGKSHLDDHGNLVPANPAGEININQHVFGGRNPEIKANSQFSSFSAQNDGIKLYGNQEIRLDLQRLQHDIARGHVQGVEIHSPERVQASVQAEIDGIAGRHVPVDLPPRATREQVERYAAELQLSRGKTKSVLSRLQAMLNTRRDHEWLVEGTIPSEYLDGPHDL